MPTRSISATHCSSAAKAVSARSSSPMSAKPLDQRQPPYGPVDSTRNIVGMPVIRVLASAISIPAAMASPRRPLAATARAALTYAGSGRSGAGSPWTTLARPSVNGPAKSLPPLSARSMNGSETASLSCASSSSSREPTKAAQVIVPSCGDMVACHVWRSRLVSWRTFSVTSTEKDMASRIEPGPKRPLRVNRYMVPPLSRRESQAWLHAAASTSRRDGVVATTFTYRADPTGGGGRDATQARSGDLAWRRTPPGTRTQNLRIKSPTL